MRCSENIVEAWNIIIEALKGSAEFYSRTEALRNRHDPEADVSPLNVTSAPPPPPPPPPPIGITPDDGNSRTEWNTSTIEKVGFFFQIYKQKRAKVIVSFRCILK